MRVIFTPPHSSSFLAAGLLAAVAPCCPEDGVGNATLSFDDRLSSLGWMTVGDTSTAAAIATTSNFCTVYTATERPDQFTYETTDSSVAPIDQRGVVSARAPGSAELTAKVEGFTSNSLHLMVSPPFATLGAVPRDTGVSVGDTVFITVRSFDAAGQEVSGVWTEIPSDSISVSPPRSIRPLVSHYGSRLETPATFWFIPLYPGVLSFVASAPNLRPARRASADTVRVNVRPQ